jgi:hypothetical protein
VAFKYECRMNGSWASPIEEYATEGDAMAAVCRLLDQNLATDARIVLEPERSVVRTFEQIEAFCQRRSSN